MGMCIYGCTPHTNLSNEGTTHQDGGKGEPASSTTERSRITRKKRAARQSQTQREKEAEKKERDAKTQSPRPRITYVIVIQSQPKTPNDTISSSHRPSQAGT